MKELNQDSPCHDQACEVLTDRASDAMLPKKVTNSAAIAIVACIASGVAHAMAMIASFRHSVDLWPAWLEIFAIAAFMIGLGAGIFSYLNAPAKPHGWRPARRWTFGRSAPAAVYFALVTLSLAIVETTGSASSELVWKVITGTASQSAFVLLVWENWWVWRQFTRSNAIDDRLADAVAGRSGNDR